MSLTNQHVLVFGGSSGLGLAIAGASLARGARVTIAARDPDRLAAAAARLAVPDRLTTRVADVADETAVAATLAAAGPVDHVLLTAIVPTYGPIRELDLAAARRTVDSKLFAALAIAKHARLPRHGSFTVLSGIAATRPGPGGAVVAAANGALEAVVRALALELAPARVNALSPGWVDTPALDALMGAAKAQRLADRARILPVGRTGHPDDLAHAALFLMENGYTTGIVLPVDGGHRFA